MDEEDQSSAPLLDEQEELTNQSTMGTPPTKPQVHGHLSRSHQTVVQSIFFLLGIGILAPWNAFISAKDYFETRLCDGGSSNQSNFENKFGLVYNLAGITSLLLLISVQAFREEKHKHNVSDHRTTEESCVPSRHLEHDPLNRTTAAAGETTDAKKSSSSSSYWLVMVPLSIYCSAFFVQVILVVLPSVTTSFLPLTFGSLAVTAMAVSVAQVGIVATATEFRAEIAMSPYLAVR